MRYALLVLVLLGLGCRTPYVPGSAPVQEPVVTVTVLQFNDVYEITPVGGGREGGLARVAALRRQLLAENPNVLTVLAGDFFSPSALGTARVEGQRLDGRQMVAVLNTLGLDVATFGNHEFDLSEQAFHQRLAESRFSWVSTNVSDTLGNPFPGTRRYRILPFRTGTRTVRVGLLAVTLDSNRKPYVRYADPVASLRAHLHALRDSADVWVALTHLGIEQDIALAEAVPELDLLLGGHEHENIHVLRGGDFTPIAKADANVRSVYVHTLRFDPATARLTVDSRFVPVTDAVPEDPVVKAEVERWVALAYAGFRAQGFDPNAVVATSSTAFDGRESVVRNQSNALTDLMAQAVLAEGAGADLALFNGGSIRIDDVLMPGAITQYDVIRLLPFGGPVLTVSMSGRLLARVLDQGLANRGTGGYLHTANVVRDSAGWRIQGASVDPERRYTVALPEFLTSGQERGLGYLKLGEQPDLALVARHRDIRLAVIDLLKRRFP
jgi:5'-nucleotidase